MFMLLKGADVYAPGSLGVRDILCAAGKIVAVSPPGAGFAGGAGIAGGAGFGAFSGAGFDPTGLPGGCEVLDCRGMRVAPGLVDGHVHVTGGGGEGGFATRTPELSVAETFLAGVTSVVGMLGTDGVARDMESLVAKTYGLRERGLSAWCLSGSYRVPPRTLTGDLMKDIMMIEPVIGAGEIAVSDHRSSKPTAAELARIAAEARVGGMLSGKAGIVVAHLGDAPAGFAPLREAVAAGDLPIGQFLPTHCARNPSLFGQALEWLRDGGWIDLTAPGAAAAFVRARAEGLPVERVTVSSDGQGSLPVFGPSGELVGMGVGTCAALMDALRDLVRARGVPLEEALPPFTSSPARVLGLKGKGRIEAGADADFVVLDADLRIRDVVAGGRLAVKDGRAEMKGAFER